MTLVKLTRNQKVNIDFNKDFINTFSKKIQSNDIQFVNQTLKDFSVKKMNEEKYYISAPMRDSRGFQMGVTKRVFDIRTRELLNTEI